MPSPMRPAAEIEAELAEIAETERQALLSDNVDPDVTDVEAKPAPTGQSEAETEARRHGWRPQEEFAGDKSKWVDAETFLKRGERFTKNLEKKVEKLEAQIAQFEGTKKAFREFFDREVKKRDAEHAQEIASLKTQLRAAVREGDDAVADTLEEQIQTAQEQHRLAKESSEKLAKEQQAELPTGNEPTTATAKVDIDPVLREWVADGNEWFDTEPALTKYATELAAYLRQKGEPAIGREFLEKVAAQVRKDFPRKFRELDAAAGRAPRQSPTSGGASTSNNGKASSQIVVNGKTKSDLPAEDLAVMKQFIREGLYTEESFLKSYFSRNA